VVTAIEPTRIEARPRAETGWTHRKRFTSVAPWRASEGHFSWGSFTERRCHSAAMHDLVDQAREGDAAALAQLMLERRAESLDVRCGTRSGTGMATRWPSRARRRTSSSAIGSCARGSPWCSPTSTRRCDRALALRPFLTGERFSLADVSLMPYIASLPLLRASHLLSAVPHLGSWWERMQARPSWRALDRGELKTDTSPLRRPTKKW